MKILLVSSLYYPQIIGGAEISTQLLAESLVKETEFQIHVLTTGGEDSDEVLNGVFVHRRRMTNISSFWDFKKSHNSLKRFAYKLLDFYSVANKKIINKLLEDIRPDVVHINNIYGFSAAIWSVVSGNNIPIVNTYRDYFVMCPRANLMSKGHTCTKPKLMCALYRNMFRKFMSKVDTHVSISKYVHEKLLENLHYDSKIIYNSINVDYSAFDNNCLRKMKRSRSITRFVYVGGLIPTKGILEFSEIFAGCDADNIEFHIIGEGSLKKDILALKRNNIILHGFMTGDSKRAIMEEMDIAVCPSLWNEPFGRVVIEAYQYAMPVIGTNLGGLPELIDEQTGIVCDSENRDSLKNAIKFYASQWKGLDSEQCKQMKERLKQFDINIQTEQYIQIYKDLAEREMK